MLEIQQNLQYKSGKLKESILVQSVTVDKFKYITKLDREEGAAESLYVYSGSE